MIPNSTGRNSRRVGLCLRYSVQIFHLIFYYCLSLINVSLRNDYVTCIQQNKNKTNSVSTHIPLAVSYNQPKFNAFTYWNANATTFATSGTVGTTPYGLFVSTNNTVYVANRANSRIQIWLEGRTIPTSNITNGLAYPYSIFVTVTGDIYVDNGYSNDRVDKWTFNRTTSSSAMYVKAACYGLFVDIRSNVYCSMYNIHQVVTKSLNSDSSMWIVAAGTDCSGSTSNTLNNPRGIFVDAELNLYVADCGNDRIQQFPSGQVTGITVAGSTATGTITLNCPSGVVLDGDGYFFIVDSYNHRIVGSGPNGFRCIVGCSAVAGSTSSQLSSPSDLKFDSYGNIFVTDQNNNRIQKFILITTTTYPAPTTVQTTAVPTTSAIQTTKVLTTNAIRTTVASTINAIESTVVPTTSAIDSTAAPITSVIDSTVNPTTIPIDSTAGPTTSAIETAVVQTISAVETTAAPTTSAVETTADPTTSAVETTAAPTTTNFQIGLHHQIFSD
ncbi:unnamed protein product [Rotaria sp. Silwood2]|nr:unnamed protein product [Rotaria sp. Silwood2]CAF3132465.1 unnamed protein product [Rotaria sp. Silwood2]CAF3380543.1 unnamed protein product [Rotaria sp. Silwood2]CAF4193792.1 unnamed protein product [Rotaria sp. Silwood2]CAF4278509.1 unnamed protein product [Rotaria sp. Silwood2]